jgi:beta-glucuronidase
MLRKIPFLRGTCPWILYDFRTPWRMQPAFQDGWNRKGLLSDKGEKKKAWYVMRKFYAEKSKEQVNLSK